MSFNFLSSVHFSTPLGELIETMMPFIFTNGNDGHVSVTPIVPPTSHRETIIMLPKHYPRRTIAADFIPVAHIYLFLSIQKLLNVRTQGQSAPAPPAGSEVSAHLHRARNGPACVQSVCVGCDVRWRTKVLNSGALSLLNSMMRFLTPSSRVRLALAAQTA